MNKKLVKILLVALSSFSTLVFIISTTLFAWFNFNKDTSSIILTTGNIKINEGSPTIYAYKYNYPTFGEYSLYDEKGVVRKNQVVDNSDLNMNLYDPLMVDIEGTSNCNFLYTNLPIKINIGFKTTTDCTLKIKVVKLTSWDNAKKRITDYIDFYTVSNVNLATAFEQADFSTHYDGYTYKKTSYKSDSEAQYTNYTSSEISSGLNYNNLYFYSMKNLKDGKDISGNNTQETYLTSQHFYNSAQTTLELFCKDYRVSSLPYLAQDGTRYAEYSEEVCLQLEYNVSLLQDAFLSNLEEGEIITLHSDYYFLVEVSQNENLQA